MDSIYRTVDSSSNATDFRGYSEEDMTEEPGRPQLYICSLHGICSHPLAAKLGINSPGY